MNDALMDGVSLAVASIDADVDRLTVKRADSDLDRLTVRLSSLEHPPHIGDLVYYPSYRVNYMLGASVSDSAVNTPAIVVSFVPPYADPMTGKLMGGGMDVMRTDGEVICGRRLDGWHVVSTFGDAL